jgi:peptidoglycan/LPS O-acetylase OafA/YrhL
MLAKPLQPVPRHSPIYSLTGLRFFAAVAVVVFHYGAPLLQHFPGFVKNIASSGGSGVALFFMLSGFVLAYNYADPAKGPLGKKEFWRARFARIYPVYLLSLLLTLNRFAWLLHPFSRTNIRPAFTSFVMAVTLTQGWSFSRSMIWNYPAWTLSSELLFYLTFPWTLALANKLKPNLLLPVVLGLLACDIGVKAMVLSLNPSAFGVWVISGWPPLRLPEFLIGLVLGKMFLVRPEAGIRQRDAVSILTIIGIFTTLSFPLPGAIAQALLAPLFALLIFTLASGPGIASDLLSLPALVLLGSASYSMYILQVPVMTACERWLGRSALTFCIGLLVLTGVSIVTSLYFEAPARRWLRGKWTDRRQPLVSAAA